MVLKSSIRTSASPRGQQSHWGVRVTQDAYFSLLIHTKQLLLVTFHLQDLKLVFGGDGTGTGTGTTEPRTDGQTNVEVEIVI